MILLYPQIAHIKHLLLNFNCKRCTFMSTYGVPAMICLCLSSQHLCFPHSPWICTRTCTHRVHCVLSNTYSSHQGAPTSHHHIALKWPSPWSTLPSHSTHTWSPRSTLSSHSTYTVVTKEHSVQQHSTHTVVTVEHSVNTALIRWSPWSTLSSHSTLTVCHYPVGPTLLSQSTPCLLITEDPFCRHGVLILSPQSRHCCHQKLPTQLSRAFPLLSSWSTPCRHRHSVTTEGPRCHHRAFPLSS